MLGLGLWGARLWFQGSGTQGLSVPWGDVEGFSWFLPLLLGDFAEEGEASGKD